MPHAPPPLPWPEGSAVHWALDRLPAFIRARTPHALLLTLVTEAAALCDGASAWAVTWRGDAVKGTASFQALAASNERVVRTIPAPAVVSRTILGRVVSEGEPWWSENAAEDGRVQHAESIRANEVRSVACLPLGERGVLYVHDPVGELRFPPELRARLVALCALAGRFLAEMDTSSRPEAALVPVPGMIGSSPAMRELFASIHAFAPMPWPALVLGETGTGKELVARGLHLLSPRREQPFVAVNCGAIPDELAESTLFGHEKGAFTGADRPREGLVERVGRGTLFLDEVGELSPRAQVKLLRLLQEGVYERVGGTREARFHGRVVAATLRALDDPAKRGAFREDLFHRLGAAVLRVPALRERREDIPALARHVLGAALGQLPGSPALTLGEDLVEALESRPWPGNVRQLENVVRGAVARALASGDHVLTTRHIEEGARGTAVPTLAYTRLDAAIEAFQRQHVEAVLASCRGNRSLAAEKLGVSRQWLHKLLARWADEDRERNGP